MVASLWPGPQASSWGLVTDVPRGRLSEFCMCAASSWVFLSWSRSSFTCRDGGQRCTNTICTHTCTRVHPHTAQNRPVATLCSGGKGAPNLSLPCFPVLSRDDSKGRSQVSTPASVPTSAPCLQQASHSPEPPLPMSREKAGEWAPGYPSPGGALPVLELFCSTFQLNPAAETHASCSHGRTGAAVCVCAESLHMWMCGAHPHTCGKHVYICREHVPVRTSTCPV